MAAIADAAYFHYAMPRRFRQIAVFHAADVTLMPLRRCRHCRFRY